ncbi:MAG: Large exoprotein involved in heme utilization or adhesion, partial [Frankiales bacterium]|nr:Large exoprotein involved in heme utilization or adhesion [Frankiales bacterium]
VGGNLNIESLQDTSVFNSQQRSIGGSVTIGFGGGASANFGSSNINSNFASVIEQRGSGAGDDGFQIDVRGNTGLRGGVISSPDEAAAARRNRLTTGTLTQSDIENRADFRGQSLSLGGGFGGVGRDQPGQAQTGAGQVPGTTLPSLGGFSATPPIALNARGEAGSTTRSGISPADVQITDEAKQQATTGRGAADTVAMINRDVSTDRNTTNALKPIFNEQEIQAGFAISGAFAREAGNFLALRAKQADLKEAQAKKAEADAADPKFEGQSQALIDRAAALRAEARDITATWGPGATNRQVLSALVAAASGNVSGSTASFIQAGVVNFVQQQGAAYIGKLVAEGSLTEGSHEHAALHAIVACAGAAASSQSCGAGALGAATSSLLTNLFKQPEPGETNSQREAKGNIINTIVAGTALALGGSAADQTATAVIASDAAVQNNFLTQRELAQRRAALAKCKPDECEATRQKFLKISNDRKDRMEIACLTSPTQCRRNAEEIRVAVSELAEDLSRLPEGAARKDAQRNLAQAISDYKTNLQQLEDAGNKVAGEVLSTTELARRGFLTPKEAADQTAFKSGKDGELLEIVDKGGNAILMTIGGVVVGKVMNKFAAASAGGVSALERDVIGRIARPGDQVVVGTGRATGTRLQQDINVDPVPAPARNLTGRDVGASPSQNAAMRDDVAYLESIKATGIRINQQQLNAAECRVGTCRPDVQATLPNGRRVVIEYDTAVSTRGAGHATRALSNNPNCW